MDVGKCPVGLIRAMEAEHLGCCIERAIPYAIKQVGKDEDQPGWTGSFGWNLQKKGSWPLKKGQANQKAYKDVVRLCREKIRRAKLELNLATDIKDDEKCFYKYVSN